MSRATVTGFFTASENSISPKGVLCSVTSCAGVDRREHSDGPAMYVMMFLASKRTPTEFTCTPSVIRWSVCRAIECVNCRGRLLCRHAYCWYSFFICRWHYTRLIEVTLCGRRTVLGIRSVLSVSLVLFRLKPQLDFNVY